MLYVHFKMDTVSSDLKLNAKNCFMSKVDIKDAYYSAPINIMHQKKLNFCMVGNDISSFVSQMISVLVHESLQNY